LIVHVGVELVEWQSTGFETVDERGKVGPDSRQALLRIRTADGVEGQCFFGASQHDMTMAVAQISEVLRPMVVGTDEADHRALWALLPKMIGHGLTLRPGWAPIDIALWDIAGKVAKLPIVEMLGRVRDRIPVYATHPPMHRTASELLPDVERLLADGISAYKLHPGPLSPASVAECAVGLRGLGEEIDYMLDPNNRYTLTDALIVARALDDARFRWFEDPFPVGEILDTLTLARSIATPVTVSDSVSFDIPQMRFFAKNGLHTLRTSSRWAGITGLIQACETMAEVGGSCEIGLGGNPSMNVANLHVMSSVANCAYYEHWLPAARHEFGVLDPPTPEAGWISVPLGSGLGLEIDERWIDRHRVAVI
jgi:L-alanine-DL-glutamate epimerase-like enolase superfamily enzyme